MKKFLFLLCVVAACFSSTYAQSVKPFSVAAGANVNLPLGDFNEAYSFGLGVEAQAEYMFSELFSAVGSAGATHFFGKDIEGYKVDNVTLIPFLAGARIYAIKRLFVGAKIGYGLFVGSGDSNGGFLYSPHAGLNFESLQLALSYNGWNKDHANLSHLGLTALFKFGKR